MSNAQVLLKGDAVAGAAHIAFAKAKLTALREVGLEHAQRTFVVSGATIQIDIRPEGDRIYIEASSSACPMIQYSGYLDTAAPYDTPPTLMYGVRKVPAYSHGTDPVPVLPPSVTLPAETYPRVSVKAQAHYTEFDLFFKAYKPTRFTGIMRKVLQCTFATATWRDSLCFKTGTQYKFHLNYQWNDSWGVVLEPGKDGSKGEHYFLIQIVYNTVNWVEADFCVHKVKVAEVDAYAPVVKSIRRSHTTVLGTLPSLGGSSCSTPVGWSFSYTQPKASVVIYGDDGQTHVTVKLVTLDIQFSGGKPASITQTIGTPQILWGPHDSRSQGILHVPTQKPMAPEGILINMTLTSIKQPYAVSNPPQPYAVSNIPVHVYYLPGKDAPEIVGYSYQETAATGYYSTNMTLENALSPGFGTDQGETNYISWGFTMNGASLPSIHGGRNKSWNTIELSDTVGAP